MRAKPLLNRDFAAGLIFAAVGIAGLWIGRDLATGTAAEMGPGYFPRAMCVALVALGAVIALLGVVKGGEPLPRVAWRPILFVTIAILAFMATLESLGVIAAVVATVAIANFAGAPMRARTVILLAAVLTLGVLAIFVWGLGLPIHALPRLAR